MIRFFVYMSIGLLAGLTFLGYWPVDLQCCFCGEWCHTESIGSRMASFFSGSFVHDYCAFNQ